MLVKKDGLLVQTLDKRPQIYVSCAMTGNKEWADLLREAEVSLSMCGFKVVTALMICKPGEDREFKLYKRLRVLMTSLGFAYIKTKHPSPSLKLEKHLAKVFGIQTASVDEWIENKDILPYSKLLQGSVPMVGDC